MSKTKLWNGLTDPLPLKLFFVVVPFLCELPLLMPYLLSWQKLGLVWAAALLIRDIFRNRRMLRMRYAVWIWPFLICCGMTVLLNRSASLRMNAIEFCYTTATLLMLYPVPGRRDKERFLKELSVLSYTLSFLTAVTATIAIGMFVVQMHTTVTFHGVTYHLGVFLNRLVGLYRNAIYPTSAIGLFAAVIQLVINHSRRARARTPRMITVLLWYAILVNFITVALQNSRGLFIGLTGALVLGAVLYCLRGRSSRFLREKPLPLRSAVACVVAVCVAGGLALATLGTRELFARVPVWYVQMTGHVTEESETWLDEGEIDMNREEKDETLGVLTGRQLLWKQGFSYFAEKPFFGYGPFTLSDELRLTETNNQQISHFHNIFVQALVSNGLLGFVFLALLLGCGGFYLLRQYWQQQDMPGHDVLVAVLMLLAFLLIINQADTTILYQTKHSGFVFWIYTGYAVALASDNQPFALDAPLQRLARRLPGRRGQEEI